MYITNNAYNSGLNKNLIVLYVDNTKIFELIIQILHIYPNDTNPSFNKKIQISLNI